MKTTSTSEALINVAMWVSVGAAIIVGLFVTERLGVLWFFLIPALSRAITNSIKESEERGREQRRCDK